MRRARVVLVIPSVRALVETRSRDDGPITDTCFTEAELNALSPRRDPVPSLAARLAAKLATVALLGRPADWRAGPLDLSAPSDEQAAALRRVQIHTTPGGAPRLCLEPGDAATIESGWVSLSHDAALAAALVVLEAPSNAP